MFRHGVDLNQIEKKSPPDMSGLHRSTKNRNIQLLGTLYDFQSPAIHNYFRHSFLAGGGFNGNLSNIPASDTTS